jgi:hypothetical protein
MLAMKANSDPHAVRIRSPAGPARIANPREPIRVTLARDEEAAGLESEATRNPPPAYGHWRYTVVGHSFVHGIEEALLTLTFRESILTSSFGSETIPNKQRQRKTHSTDLGPPIDLHHISLRTV